MLGLEATAARLGPADRLVSYHISFLAFFFPNPSPHMQVEPVFTLTQP